jgi:hypothetical protein
VVFGIALAVPLVGCGKDDDDDGDDSERERIEKGLTISPVALDLNGKDRDLVGLGSYIVNAQAACNDCHTNPPFAPGGDPFQGQPTHINTARFLAGGTVFPPTNVVSANITPDASGNPAGLSYDDFKRLVQTGREANGELLQVMPWPIYANMNDRDIRAIYEYLRAIPSVPSGP